MCVCVCVCVCERERERERERRKRALRIYYLDQVMKCPLSVYSSPIIDRLDSSLGDEISLGDRRDLNSKLEFSDQWYAVELFFCYQLIQMCYLSDTRLTNFK